VLGRVCHIIMLTVLGEAYKNLYTVTYKKTHSLVISINLHTAEGQSVKKRLCVPLV
jgi:hypothetical protein